MCEGLSASSDNLFCVVAWSGDVSIVLRSLFVLLSDEESHLTNVRVWLQCFSRGWPSDGGRGDTNEH